MVDLSESSKRIFTRSRRSSMRSLGYSDEVSAVYDQDKVFIGWNRGGSDLFERIWKKALNLSLDESEARKKTLRVFKESTGNIREPVYIDRRSADLLAMAAQRGSGKSFNLRALTNRSTKAGVNNLILDPEHEFYTNNFSSGVQNDLMNLREREVDESIDTQVLMPEFVREARKKKRLGENGYQHTLFFQFGFDDLDAEDISFLLKKKIKGSGSDVDFDLLRSELQSRLDSGELIRDWSDVKDIVSELDEGSDGFTYSQRGRQINTYIENVYERYSFFGSRKQLGVGRKPSLPEIFSDNSCVVLSLNDAGKLSDDLMMKELYVAIFVKKLRSAVERGEISKPVSISLDEAHEFIPVGADSDDHMSKRQLEEVATDDRKRGFRLNLASQEPTHISEENFLNECRHFFIPGNMPDKPRKHLLKKAGVYMRSDSNTDKWDTVFGDAMDFLEFPWLYCDKKSGDWMILEVASPLANHLTE